MKKNIKTLVSAVLFTALVAANLTAASKSKGKEPKMNAGRPEVIDYQGQALGLEIPAWVKAVGDGNEKKVRKSLDIPSDDAIFILSNKGNDLDFLKTWTDQVDVRAEVASSLEQTVGQVVQAEMSAKQTDEQTKTRAAKLYSSSMTNLTLNGLAKEAYYWIKTRTLKTGLKKAKTEADYNVEYTYYVVFTINKALYEVQLAKAMDDVDDNDDQTSFLKAILTEKLTQAMVATNVDTVNYDNVPVEDVE